MQGQIADLIFECCLCINQIVADGVMDEVGLRCRREQFSMDSQFPLADIVQSIIAALFIALAVVSEECPFLFQEFQHVLFVHEFLELDDFHGVFSVVTLVDGSEYEQRILALFLGQIREFLRLIDVMSQTMSLS